MESEKVKILRKVHGIYDSNNEYTEDQIYKIIFRKIHVIKYDRSNERITCASVLGYISDDGCIWIKSEQDYMPIKLLRHCDEISTKVYADLVDKEIFCLDKNDIEYAATLIKNNIIAEKKDEIKILEDEIKLLENSEIEYFK